MEIVAVPTIGLDLGDRSSYWVKQDEKRQVVGQGKVRTSKQALKRRFADQEGCRVVVEAGTHSAWVMRLLTGLGMEVIVANPRQIPWLTRNQKKTDRTDAEWLARVGQLDPKLLKPISHREVDKLEDLAVIKARDQLMSKRSSLISHVRGLLKSFGIRVRKCSTASFAKVAGEQSMPEELQRAVGPVLGVIKHLSQAIKAMDRQVLSLCEDKYPETAAVMQIRGVGPLTALAFVLTLGSPAYFRDNRAAGPYLGLVRKVFQSGDRDLELGISKAGNKLLRRLLVNCAHYILGHFGPDSDLRRHGLKIAASGGKAARKKAVVAVARKLSVLMLHLWRTGELYEPLYNAQQKAA